MAAGRRRRRGGGGVGHGAGRVAPRNGGTRARSGAGRRMRRRTHPRPRRPRCQSRGMCGSTCRASAGAGSCAGPWLPGPPSAQWLRRGAAPACCARCLRRRASPACAAERRRLLRGGVRVAPLPTKCVLLRKTPVGCGRAKSDLASTGGRWYVLRELHVNCELIKRAWAAGRGAEAARLRLHEPRAAPCSFLAPGSALGRSHTRIFFIRTARSIRIARRSLGRPLRAPPPPYGQPRRPWGTRSHEHLPASG